MIIDYKSRLYSSLSIARVANACSSLCCWVEKTILSAFIFPMLPETTMKWNDSYEYKEKDINGVIGQTPSSLGGSD